jgi:hypothetical protein
MYVAARARQVGERFPSMNISIGLTWINKVIIAIFLSSVLVFILSEEQEDALHRHGDGGGANFNDSMEAWSTFLSLFHYHNQVQSPYLQTF